MKTAFSIAAALLMATACNQSVPEDIPCDGDDQCPTGFFCLDDTCASGATSSPANMVVLGVRSSMSGAPSTSVDLSATGFQSFDLVLENAGGSEADYPTVTFQAPDCLHIGDLERNEVGVLPANESVDATVDVDPDPGCPSPVTVEVQMVIQNTSSSVPRTDTGQFEVVLQ